MIAANGRLEIMRDGGQERGPQAIRLGRKAGAIHVLDQTDAFCCLRGLIGQGMEQAPLLGGEKDPWLVAVDADHAHRTPACPHGDEQPLGTRKRIGATSGLPIMLEGPLGGAQIGLVEQILRRIAGLQLQLTVLRHQDDDPDLEHRSDLERRRPQEIVQGADASRACG